MMRRDRLMLAAIALLLLALVYVALSEPPTICLPR